MKKIKVLFFINTLSGGGAEKVLINIVNNIDSNKFEVTLQTLYNTGVYISELKDIVKYKTVVKNTTSFLGKIIVKIVNKMVINFNSKILHKLFIHKDYDCEVAFLEGIPTKIISGGNGKVPKIAWIHTDLINNKESEIYYKDINEIKNTYERFDKLVGVSKLVIEQFVKKYPVLSSKCLVKYNPIASGDILQKSLEPIEEDISKNGYLICSIGRYTEQKAFKRLINIHKRLLDEGITNTLWIIGEGDKRADLELQIKKLNVEKTCKLLGFKNNPYKYLRKADLFVCSSLAEGFSTVVCEATIVGIPIVTTLCAGMDELLGNDNEYGIITKNNEEDLFLGIKEMLNNKELYNSYKDKIQQRGEMFSLLNSMKEIEQLLEDTVNEKDINNSK